MATKSVNDILARARVIATGMGGDANMSPVIDNRAALRALLDTALSDVYSRRAADMNDRGDTVVRHTVVLAGGTGAVPNTILRKYLHQAEFRTDTATDWIGYSDTETDARVRYTQMGYVFVRGDSFIYIAPGGDEAFDGNLYVSTPSLPDIPSNPDTALAMTDEVYDDLCYTLARAVRNEANLAMPATTP